MSRLVAVTGATGFIGRHLTAHLVARGMDVRAIVRPDSPHPVPEGATLVRAPLLASALEQPFTGVDTVVHLAGVLSALDLNVYSAVNVEGTRAVAEAARRTGARLIHVSSLAASGPASAETPRAEDDPPNPVTPYGKSKLAGEHAVTSAPGLGWTILRPAVVYGPADRAMFPLFQFAKRGILPMIGRSGAAYTFIHVSDVVRAIDAVVDAAATGAIMFVGHPQPATAPELLEGIRSAVGRPARLIRVPRPLVRGAVAAAEVVEWATGRPQMLNRWRYAELRAEGFVCRVDRIRVQLGVVAAIDLREGLAQTAEWYRREGWL